ncbi:hypothetical protein SAMN05421688_0081 [Poseidonocella pacifica]|uniref:N-ATPase, AtpR subunit n=1 Tax=Poseidonocella pacifica TaxID=871651 RepID=A0A1I0UZ57_9RHOB|nr:ATP synthase subunit AtpR [Poseidonocella pacifica]SFA69067.1 hypothetical protein SAMN05421688_0081 [Poseidonocella pacifica]
MIAVDWPALGLGLAAGTLVSALFFAGLAFGMQRALRAGNAIATLGVSAALRISGLLAIGWLIATLAGPWAFAGYGIAFFICRRMATAMARAPVRAGGSE